MFKIELLHLFSHFCKRTPINNMANFLVVGLGNIGAEYHQTRHNIGFDVLDFIAQENNLSFATDRLAGKTLWRLKGRNVYLIKPSTYMNLSGKALRYWKDKLHVPPENILVIVDDISLDLGKLRLRKNGSSGGHNGLKNIEEVLQTQQYPRLRFGIGNQFSTGKQVDFVLGKWSAEELQQLQEPIARAAEAIQSFVLQGIEPSMNLYNK
ncbi:MAG: aminoacyl-tRNA hydrolase [Bacteroidetes bacterium]|nr:aminoacyl-tRNA hydrolase [Bacteroidota bacterium]